MPRSRSRSALALAALSLTACAASPLPPPEASPSAATVIEWAVGPEHLDAPPLSSGSYLLLVNADAAKDEAPPPAHKCYDATTILPAPAPPGRVYAIIGGQLHAFETRNSPPVALKGAPPAVTFTRLLAFARAASPLRLLVAARPAGAKSEQISALTLSDDAIVTAAEVTDKRAFASQEAFFRQYDAPRCKPDGKECVALSSNGTTSFLDVERARGTPPTTLRSLPIVALDASWASSESRQIYLLVPCPKPPPSAPSP